MSTTAKTASNKIVADKAAAQQIAEKIALEIRTDMENRLHAYEASKAAQELSMNASIPTINVEETKSEEKTMTTFLPIPAGVDGNRCFVELTGLAGTLADTARTKPALVWGTKIPVVKGRIVTLVREVEGDRPVESATGRYLIKVVSAGENEYVVLITGDGMHNKKITCRREAQIEALSHLSVGDIRRFSDIGCLIRKGATKMEKMGVFTELPQWAITIDRAASASTQSEGEYFIALARQQGLKVAQAEVGALLGIRKGLTLRGQVQPCATLPINLIGVGRQAAEVLRLQYNTTAEIMGWATVETVEEMNYMPFSQCGRYPTVSTDSIMGNLRMILMEDETYGVYAHPETMLKMNADADGDALSSVLNGKNFLPHKDYMKAVLAYGPVQNVGLPVDKNGEAWNPLSVAGEKASDPIEVALGLAAGKAPVGPQTNGFLRLIILVCALSPTPEIRTLVLQELGAPVDANVVNNGRLFRRQIGRIVRVAFGCASERLQSVRKDGNIWKAGLLGLQRFFAEDGYKLNAKDFIVDGEWMEADGHVIDAKMVTILNTLKNHCGGLALAKAMKQSDVLKETVGHSDNANMAKFIARHGVQALLDIIDGTAVPVIDEVQTTSKWKYQPKNETVVRALAGFKSSDLTEDKNYGWDRLCKFVCAQTEKVNSNVTLKVVVSKATGRTMLVVDGQPVEMPSMAFTLENGVITDGKRSYRWTAVPTNSKTAECIDYGIKPEIAITMRVESILDILADEMVSAVAEVRAARLRNKNGVADSRIVRDAIATVTARGYHSYQAHEAQRMNVAMDHVKDSPFPGTSVVNMDKTMYEIAYQCHQGLLNPMTGEVLQPGFGYASKSNHMQVVALLKDGETTTVADRSAHVRPCDAGGRNETREGREAHTVYTALDLENADLDLDSRMVSGGEDKDILVKSKDLVVFIGDVSTLGIHHNGRVDCFDNALLTRTGSDKMQVVRRPQQRVGLTMDTLATKLMEITGKDDAKMATAVGKLRGYKIEATYAEYVGILNNKRVYEQRYTLTLPCATGHQNVVKLYAAGWKGVCQRIDQDIMVKDINGNDVKVDLIMDSRTASGKKMQFAVLAGMLGLAGQTDFSQETYESVQSKVAAACGDVPYVVGVDMDTNTEVGAGIATALRTFAFKQDDDDFSVKANGMKQSWDVMSYTAAQCRVSKGRMEAVQSIVDFANA